MLGFLATPLGRQFGLALAALALIAGFYGFARHQGANSIRKADEKATQAAKLDLAKHEAAAANISATASSNLVQRQAQIITRTRTIVQKVKEYVPASADAQCVVPVGFVRLHDAAAAGTVPTPASGSDQAASGYGLSDVSRTVIQNYGVAFGWKSEALAWRDWYAKQRDAWNAK